MGYVAFNKPEEALPNSFKHYTRNLKVGICVSITGSPTLKTGCGKSLTSIGLSDSMDPYFSMRKVGISPAEFLDGIDSFSENTWGEKIKPDQCVIMDEGEIAAPSSLWFSFTNRAIFYTLATFRNTRGIAFIITPSLKWIDSRMRTLLAFWGYTDKTYSTYKTSVKLRMFKISTDMLGETMYYRKLRLYDRTNKRVTIFKAFDVKKPNPELEAAYEEKSNKFKVALRKDLAQDVAKFEKLTSYRADGSMENGPMKAEDLAKILIDDAPFRETLFSNCRGSRGFSTALLRTSLERKGYYLKLGEAELLKKILLKEWLRNKYDG